MNVEKHCETKISLRLDDMRSLWSDVNDKKRLEILKSIIWTSPNNQEFYTKAMRVLNSERFQKTLD